MLGGSESHVGTHSTHKLQVASRQIDSKFLKRKFEHPIEPPRPLEGRPPAVILRHPLGPEMELNKLITRWKLKPVGERERVFQTAHFDTEHTIWMSGKFDDVCAATERRV